MLSDRREIAPLLFRQLAKWRVLRSPMVRLVGTDSRLVGRLRLYLFGVDGKQALDETQAEQDDKQEDVPLTWQAARVSEEIQQARSRQIREGNPTRVTGG